ncbi:MAG: hypothetical protein ACI9LV_000650 [Candidatus Nanohaloarchaea archaeon]|jgi:hypothetical protein
MDAEEILDLDVNAIMEQDFYCHLCEEEGREQELVTRYHVEERESYRPGRDKYTAVAEQGCPRPEHVEVDFRITETFYSQS